MQRQDKGKGLTLVSASCWLWLYCGYKYENTVANMKFNVPGVRHVTNAGMREFFAHMVENDITEHLIVITEADRVYPGRLFKDPKRVMDLMDAFQDEKLDNTVLWDGHADTGVDKILRSATTHWVVPEYIADDDVLVMKIVNGDHLVLFEREVSPASALFPLYDRWERIR